jgi:DNA-binding PadR family transcriptional regulator
MFEHRQHAGACFGFSQMWEGKRRFHHGRDKGGPWGGRPFGRGFGGPGGGRKFGRGDLKYVILDLLKDQPRHGYDIIRALEERSHGFYSPSPGSVYPTLQMLEDQGYVASSEQDGKRIYSITDAGRGFLEERADVFEDIRARMASGWGGHGNPEVRLLVQDVGQLGQYLFRQGAHGALGDPEKVRRLREVVARTKTEIERIFSDDPVSETMV